MKTRIFSADKERPVADVPWPLRLLLLLALLLQLYWHSLQPPLQAQARELPSPLAPDMYITGSLGEPLAAARYLNLWLQAFDNQPGISLSFHQLDYTRLVAWLELILALDPRSQYPMLVAARVYGSVQDAQKQRVMMDYIYAKFRQNPGRYWRWLAHATIIAKHELRDLPLALKYADALATRAVGEQVPYWVRDMKIIVLEDMGELEAAKILVGALLDSGEIHDPNEIRYLTGKIADLEKKLSDKAQTVEN